MIDVANAGASLAFTGNIFDNRCQEAGNPYMKETRANVTLGPTYRGTIRKTGAGDVLFYNELVSMTGPMDVETGRLVLSNTVKMAAAPVRLMSAPSQLALAATASAQIGGLDCDTSGTLDLNGRSLDVGGPGVYGSSFAGTFANGTMRKTGWTEQSVAAGQTQAGWDVVGGMLAFGLPPPLVRYTFDDAEALGADCGRLGKTLSPTADGAVVYSADGLRGGCASFNGAGYLAAASGAGLPAGDTAFTTALWIKPNNNNHLSFTSWGYPDIHQYNSFITGGANILKHVFWQGNDDFITSAWSGNLADGQWHHLAIVYRPFDHLRIFYIDGVEFERKASSSTHNTLADANPFNVGWAKNEGTFNGRMDEVVVFAYPLSAGQIVQLKDATFAGTRPTAFGTAGTVRLERDAELALSRADQTLSSISGVGTLGLYDAVATVETASAAATNSIGRLAGDGTLVKTGVGTLALNHAKDLGGCLDLRAGAVVAQGSCTDADLKSHLVAWWNFNDRDNPGADASGNGMDVTSLTNQYATSVQGFYETWNWKSRFETLGGAAYFDAANRRQLVLKDDANHAKLPVGHSSFSIALWINPAADCSTSGSFTYWGEPRSGGKSNGFRFNNYTGNPSYADGLHLHHHFWGGDISPYEALPDGFRSGALFTGWHHVAYTYDYATAKQQFYVDGEPFGAELAAYTGQNVPAANFTIGGRPDTATNLLACAYVECFKGYMDDIMIFDRALTAAEMKSVLRGFADAPAGGTKTTTAAGTTLSVTEGTVGLSKLVSTGAVEVAEGATLALAGGGASEVSGTLTGAGTLAVTNGASLKLLGGQSFGGTVAVAGNGALAFAPGANAAIKALTLAEGVALEVVNPANSVAPAVVVTDAVVLPAEATVKVSVAADNANMPLIKMTGGVSGDVSGWTVDATTPSGSWRTSVVIYGDTLYLRTSQSGTILSIQ